MTGKEYILFDLDGTLSDPWEGITKSFRYALGTFGIEVEDLHQLDARIGPPLRDSFRKLDGFDEEQTERAVVAYRDYFARKGMYQNKLYQGIPQLLQALKDRGKTLFLATSKAEDFACKILEHFALDGYFSYVGASRVDGGRSGKEAVIRHVLEACKVEDASRCVMVGDRKYDIEGANAVGMDSIGVLYGYGDRQELEAAGATLVAGSVEALGSLLLG